MDRQGIYKLYIFQVEMVYYCHIDSCDYLEVWSEATHLDNTMLTASLWSFVQCEVWVINRQLTCYHAKGGRRIRRRLECISLHHYILCIVNNINHLCLCTKLLGHFPLVNVLLI